MGTNRAKCRIALGILVCVLLGSSGCWMPRETEVRIELPPSGRDGVVHETLRDIRSSGSTQDARLADLDEFLGWWNSDTLLGPVGPYTIRSRALRVEHGQLVGEFEGTFASVDSLRQAFDLRVPPGESSYVLRFDKGEKVLSTNGKMARGDSGITYVRWPLGSTLLEYRSKISVGRSTRLGADYLQRLVISDREAAPLPLRGCEGRERRTVVVMY